MRRCGRRRYLGSVCREALWREELSDEVDSDELRVTDEIVFDVPKDTHCFTDCGSLDILIVTEIQYHSMAKVVGILLKGV